MNTVLKNDKLQDKFCLTLANHWSYIGIGWQLGLESCVQSITDSLSISDKDPSIKTCINLDAVAYQMISEEYPEITKKLKKYLLLGKVELVAGTYSQPLGSTVGGESIIRQIVFGRNTIKKALDYEMETFLEEEEFSFPQLPQILKSTGYKFASLSQCDTWGKAGIPIINLNSFLWEAPDGTTIPTAPKNKLFFHFPVTNNVDYLLSKEGLNDIKNMQEMETPLATVWVEFGWEPKEGSMVNFSSEKYKELSKKYNVEYVTLKEYMQKYYNPTAKSIKLNGDDFNKVLAWGLGGDQVRVNDRKVEALLISSEKLNAISYMLGNLSEQGKLDESWKDLLISQSHDVSLCEYTNMQFTIPRRKIKHKKYNAPWGTIGYTHLNNSKYSAEKILNSKFEEIAEQVDSLNDAKGDMAITVFNSSSWDRSDLVNIGRIYHGNSNPKNIIVKNSKGEIVTSQIIEEDSMGGMVNPKLLFVADNVPSMGYDTYYLEFTEKSYDQKKTSLRINKSKMEIENNNIKVRFGNFNGNIISLFDKSSEKELIYSKEYSFPTFTGRPSNIHPPRIMKNFPDFISNEDIPPYDTSQSKAEFSWIEEGPVRATLKVSHILDTLRLDIYYSLDCFSNKVKVSVITVAKIPPEGAKAEGDSWILPLEIKDGYWIKFSTAFTPDKIIRDLPFGVEETKKDAIHALTFIDFSNKDNGLLLIHPGTQYFKKINKNTYSNLVMREWESHFTGTFGWPPYAEYKYVLIPHDNSYSNSDMIRRSMEFDQNLISITSNLKNGNLSKRNSFLSIDKDNIILTSFKTKDDKLELRIFECEGINTDVKIKLNNLLHKGVETNLSGEHINEVDNIGNELHLNVAPWKIKTYELF
jgi:alpha-mannosidase